MAVPGRGCIVLTMRRKVVDGDTVCVRSEAEPVRFLLVSGKPLREPVACHGPFVMNTREEIEQALKDLRNGTFIKG